jgi:hypothetical protein
MLKMIPVEWLALWNHRNPQARAKVAQFLFLLKEGHQRGAQKKRISRLFANVSS